MMLIDGEWRPSGTGRYINIVSPYDGRIINDVPNADNNDAALAVQAALKAFSKTKELPLKERCDILEKTSQRIIDEIDELSNLLVLENGKTVNQCLYELNTASRLFKMYAEDAKRIYGNVIPMGGGVPGLNETITLTVRQPLGVIVSIIPFNYPVEIWAHKIAPIIATGNSGIFVLPPECPLTILRIAQLLIECGMPSDGMQLLTGYGRDFAEVLTTHQDVQAISFTGNVETAKTIAMNASGTLKKLFFELGGSDPLIVLADADISKAVNGVIVGRLTTAAGQMCCAAKRIIVESSIYDHFIDELMRCTKLLRMGDPRHKNTDIGPLISRKAAEKVDLQVRESVAKGATIILGGKLGSGSFYPPTLMTNIDPLMPVMREEVFGPVAPIYQAQNVEEAIRIANQSFYGLQAGIFTRDLKKAFKTAMSLETGGVVINGSPSFRPGNIPFSGWKKSGNSIESSPDTLYEFTYPKSIVLKHILI